MAGSAIILSNHEKKGMFNMPDQLTVYNPATGEEIKTIPQQSATEVEEAIERSHQAFKTWSKTSANERTSLLKNGMS